MSLTDVPHSTRDRADPYPLRHLAAGRWIAGGGAELLDTNPARPGEVVARGRLAVKASKEAGR